MQVDPIKRTLKAPGTKRLKLKCGEIGIKFWFLFQLAPLYEGGVRRRRRTLGGVPPAVQRALHPRPGRLQRHFVRRGRAVQVDPMNPTLKALETKPLKLKYEELLSKFAFKINLRRYAVGGFAAPHYLSTVEAFDPNANQW